MRFDDLIESAAQPEHYLTWVEIEECARLLGIEASGLCDEIAVTVARRFLAGTMPFWDATHVVHVLFTASWTRGDPGAASCLPGRGAFGAFAMELLEAFEIGEYNHPDGLDPIEAHARPELVEIVARFDAAAASAPR